MRDEVAPSAGGVAARLDSVGVRLGDADVLANVSLSVPPGSTIGVVGPNGSGKTTMLRTLYRRIRPASGEVLIDSVDVWAQSARESARTTAVVPQERIEAVEMTVRDLVAMGLAPHKRAFERDTDEDGRRIDRALADVGLVELASRFVQTLSGGEAQRAVIARALVQRARLLVLDEPTNHLDVAHQLDLLDKIRGLGITVVMSLHDLDQAAGCDLVAVLDRGRLIAFGPPADALDVRLLSDVFGVEFVRVEVEGRPRLLPVRTGRSRHD